MASAKPKVRVPKSAKKGEIVEIKTLINHEMESGQRKDKEGKPIPRQIINKFEAKFNGKTIFATELHPAISANPYILFHMKVEESGELELTWTDDDGSVYTDKSKIEVA